MNETPLSKRLPRTEPKLHPKAGRVEKRDKTAEYQNPLTPSGEC